MDANGCITRIAQKCGNCSVCLNGICVSCENIGKGCVDGNCTDCPENSSTTGTGNQTSTTGCYCNADYPYWYSEKCNKCAEGETYLSGHCCPSGQTWNGNRCCPATEACPQNACCELKDDDCGNPTAAMGTLDKIYYTLNDSGCLVAHNDGCSLTTYDEPTQTCGTCCGTNGACSPENSSPTVTADSTSTPGCYCNEGYDFYNDSCIPKCNERGMTGFRDENGNCLCQEGLSSDTCSCPAGYIFVNGACHRFECKYGTTGSSNYACYIDGERCGIGCQYNGYGCKDGGICRQEECQSEVNSNAFLVNIGAQDYYGCLSNGKYCTRTANRTEWLCRDKNTVTTNGAPYWCCYAKNTFGICTFGDCYENLCPAGSNFQQVINAAHGCQFDNDIFCYREDNIKPRTWTCFRHGIECGHGCDELPCNGCATRGCPSPGEFDRVEYDETLVGCVGYKNGQKKVVCSGRTCYFINSSGQKGDTCGQECPYKKGKRDYNSPFASCKAGSCYDNCPAGTTFTKGTVYGGCVSDDLICTQYDEHWNCYFKGTDAVCGLDCSSFGKNCSSVYNPQCANDSYCIAGLEIPVNSDGLPACDTANCTAASVENGWCCSEGHTYSNGGCTLTSCPEGQVVGEGGLCVDK